MKLLVIDWCADSATSTLLASCKTPQHTIVGFELKDGAEAYRKTGVLKPDAIIINYAAKPSHGRMTADSIHKRKLTSEIPIYFINGEEDDNERVSHLGVCLSSEELEDMLL
jgi:response regulator RpfG family c-di-GMP phosphodiesterase